jgi:pimeloyl-ACP methyl ester carboxylesterase
MYYKEFGAGPPLLILHGLFGFSDNWQTIAKTFSDTHLVITPDLRNHGRSPHLEGHSYPEMAEDVRRFMEEHWIFSAILMGHSMGGKVAMQLALHHPDLVERLIVVDMAPGLAQDNHSGIFEALLSLNLAQVTTRQDIDDHLSRFVPEKGVVQFLLKNVTRDASGAFQWKMNLPVLWKHFSDILAPVSGPPFEKPTLFVRGSRSNYVEDTDFDLIYSLFPQAEIATIEDAGHWVHADQPRQLSEVITTWLGK